eukprot:UN02669
MCTFKCCGTFCAGLSIFCGLALLLTGIFLSMKSPSFHIPANEAGEIEWDRASNNCFVGAGIYGVTLILSILCIFGDKFRRGNETNVSSERLLQR